MLRRFFGYWIGLTRCVEVYEKKIIKIITTYIPKSLGLGQARPRPSHVWWLWPGLVFEEAKATSGQAKTGAFRPSWAGTALIIHHEALMAQIITLETHAMPLPKILVPPFFFADLSGLRHLWVSLWLGTRIWTRYSSNHLVYVYLPKLKYTDTVG